ncbi:MAG: UvrD-helicase domain-containing protein [Pseudomonadota bacterium]|nr:UvrD-helicase domain-containing protein [Pseudomonadota bacterium]
MSAETSARLSISERARPRAAYLESLNPEQRRAVEALDGPVLVLAGAGVGKTRVLTTRIAHMLSLGRARGQEILAVTFTNKAAREMRERIEALTGVPDGMPWMGTFHSIGAKILRRHAELVGLKPNFTILDTDDQLRLLKQLLKAENIDEKRWPARALAGCIDDWKNRGLGPTEIGAREAGAFANGAGAKLYKAYQERLKTLNAVDFGDLLLEALRLFRDNADVLEKYQERFRYILVDEYQDTNVVQYLWLRLLAQKRRNLCCVGDDDQSIYGWRGAEVENILGFERDFPDATVIRLERNYRSTGHILGLASGLIAHNRKRLGKTLFTGAEPGDRPTVRGVQDSREEAREIGDEIEAEQAKGASLADMAILVRASFQMREFEERFIEIGVPYRVIGGPRFYERAEIRDALAYLRIVAQPDDDLAFERIYNTPRRGLGEATLAILHGGGRAANVSLTQAARRMIETDELKARPRQILRDLLADFERWRGRAGAVSVEELARLVVEESGLIDMWKAEKTPEAEGRLENLKELVRSMAEFPTLEAFLEHVALVTDAERDDSGPRVSLMTLHAAKGLEFDVVFLPGWEEGLFPHQRAVDESGLAGLEEERRLAYVGITRARRRVAIYFASNRRVRGLWQSSPPSRFLDELPEAHVEVVEPADPPTYGYASRFDEVVFSGRRYDTPGWKRAEARSQSPGYQRPAPPRVIEGRALALGAETSAYRVGERVFHQKFGPGRISAVDGAKLTVDFDKSGRKMVLDSFLTREG